MIGPSDFDQGVWMAEPALRDKGASPKSRPGPNGEPRQSGANEKDGPQPKVVILTIFHMGTSSIDRATVEKIRTELRQLDAADRNNTILDVWLESPGGDGDCAYKIGLMLRHVAGRIRVVVPDYAKSAATLLSLVADEIFMAPGAELGPLDAQIGYEQEGITISALDRTRSIDDLVRTAMQIAIGGGAQVLQATQLSRSESLGAMLDFAAKFLQPVVAKLDPTMLHWSNTLLRVAVEYGRRLMLTREGCTSDIASSVPRQLMEDYPTHGFVISIDQAMELGLPVRPLSEYEYADEVEDLYSATLQRQVNLIRVIPTPKAAGSSVSSESGDETKSGAERKHEVAPGHREANGGG
ncbi:hypothetical protein CKJ65_01995 [Mycobacterium intracellulare]|nr:hypothetical protein CKJ65_01995 [Mycobacterium intracellulare]